MSLQPEWHGNTLKYVDALRCGKLQQFKDIEAECSKWWFPTLDRGSGACLHFAVDHGQIEAVKFLIEKRGVEVNQQDKSRGWTPLMRCAQMAHYTHEPYLQVFEYLLQHGADPEIKAKTAKNEEPLAGVLDVVVGQGRGWRPGEVKEKLSELIAKYEDVPKKAAFSYEGPPYGPTAMAVLKAWEELPEMECPSNWRPPPVAGFQGSQGIRLSSIEPWRPAGENDGSCFLRPMTDAELMQQSKSVQTAV